MNFVSRDWIIQRATGGGAVEDFPTYAYKPVTRDEMEGAVERFGNAHPSDEFRGHNIRYCACHATALKGATGRLGAPRV